MLAEMLRFVAFVAAVITAPGWSQRNSADLLSSQVDALISRWSQGDAPGASVVVIRDGQVVHRQGYGLASLATKERISPHTIFDIASVSKPFTAMAVMMLVERGKLRYQDTLAKFFPEFQADAGQITIRQLLGHTSGIMDYTTVWGETRTRPGAAPRTNDNVVKFLAGQKLRFPPGQRWEYSNSNYVLLAQIVSEVSGDTFAQFVKVSIFQPLGMNDTFVYDGTQTVRRDLATGYVSRGQGFASAGRNPQNFVCGDGQINSTAEDLAKWERALATEALVKASTLAEAFTAGQLNDGTPVNYGFGWGLGRYRGLSVVSHGGDTDGFLAQITRFPEQRLTVIVLSNYEQFTAPHAVANKIASLYLADDVKAFSVAPRAPDRLNDYAGTYVLHDLSLKISLEGGALWLEAAGQRKVRLVPVSREEFAIDGTQGASSLGFNKNARGEVRCLALLDQNGTTFCR